MGEKNTGPDYPTNGPFNKKWNGRDGIKRIQKPLDESAMQKILQELQKRTGFTPPPDYQPPTLNKKPPKR